MIVNSLDLLVYNVIIIMWVNVITNKDVRQWLKEKQSKRLDKKSKSKVGFLGLW